MVDQGTDAGPRRSPASRRPREALGGQAPRHRAGQHRRVGRLLPRRCTRRSTPGAATTSCCSTTTSRSSPRASCAPSPSPTCAAPDHRRRPHVRHVRPLACCTPTASTSHRWRFLWGPRRTPGPARLRARPSLRADPWLHRRIDVGLQRLVDVPHPRRGAARDRLSLPVFIKWDDAEYGAARPRGRRTRPCRCPARPSGMCPGSTRTTRSTGRRTTTQRNRLVAALLHSPYDRGRQRARSESLDIELKHLLSMQYSAAELRLLALEDVLRGRSTCTRRSPPRWPSSARAAGGVRRRRRPEPDIEAFPRARRRKPPRKRPRADVPPGGRSGLTAGSGGAGRQLRPVADLARQHPAGGRAAHGRRWWLLSQLRLCPRLGRRRHRGVVVPARPGSGSVHAASAATALHAAAAARVAAAARSTARTERARRWSWRDARRRRRPDPRDAQAAA